MADFPTKKGSQLPAAAALDDSDVFFGISNGVTSKFAGSVAVRSADLFSLTDPAKGVGLVGYKLPLTGAVGRTAHAKLSETAGIKDFGGKGDGVTNDAAAETAAHAALDAVLYPPGTYLGIAPGFNLYGNSIYNRALFGRIQSGTNADPVSDSSPVLWVQKHSVANRDTIPTNFDQCAYFGLVKRGGNAYNVSNTSYGLFSSGEGDLIAHHMRLKIQATGPNVRGYAAWMYAEVDSADIHAAHGFEVNGRNNIADFGWGSKLQLGRYCMADSSSSLNRFGSAITFGATTTGGDNGVWTGLWVEDGAIIKTPGALDNGEIFYSNGPASGGSIGGFRFGAGTYKFAMRTDEATFVNNNVYLLATGQGIRWGDPTTGVRLLGGSNNFQLQNGFININTTVSDTAIQVSGVKVMGARKTGWTADTGTAKRTANATYSGTAEASYTQATIQTLMNAVRDATQTIKALKDDYIAHGSIGA